MDPSCDAADVLFSLTLKIWSLYTLAHLQILSSKVLTELLLDKVKQHRLTSWPANEDLIPPLPGVSHLLQSTVETRCFLCHITQTFRTWASPVQHLIPAQILTFSVRMDSVCEAVVEMDFISPYLLWEAVMCVRVSMGCEVCQICPSSSAPAASADCGRLRLRETQFMTQRRWAHKTSREVWSIRPRRIHVGQLEAVTKLQAHQWCARYIRKLQAWGTGEFQYGVPKHWQNYW